MSDVTLTRLAEFYSLYHLSCEVTVIYDYTERKAEPVFVPVTVSKYER